MLLIVNEGGTVMNLRINEEKFEEIQNRKKLIEFQNDPTGYPAIDKPWERFYDKDEFYKPKTLKTVYQEIYDNNVNYPNDLALEYFYARISFNNLFKNIEKTAKALEEYGVRKGDFVTICAPGMPETIYSFYALSKIGGVANMMAPYFDPKGLVERINECESDLLIVMDSFYNVIKDATDKSRIKNVVVVPTFNTSPLGIISKSKYKLQRNNNEIFWNGFIRDGKGRDETETSSYEKNRPLAMVYSSGTTGASKGILLSNDSFQNSVQSYPTLGINLSRGQKFYQIIPTWYSTGLSTSVHLPLAYGSTVFMDPRFERDVFVKNVIKHKPNYSVAATSIYEGFLDEKLVRNSDLSHFNYPFEGGEPLRSDVAEQINEVFKKHGSDAKLGAAYGQCECGGAITTQTTDDEHSAGSVGIPLPGVTLNIMNENHEMMPYNERGVIYANTPCSMIEYYKNKEATEEYFYIDENGVKWNNTGDIGYVDENGELYVLGRSSDYSVIDGKKVYNFDIENVIMQFDEVSLCDILEKVNEDGTHTVAAHIILDDEFKDALENDTFALNDLFKRIQDAIYCELKDISFVPSLFKIRTEFPCAPSGKRDIKKMKEETEGFIKMPQYVSSDKRLKLSL